MSTITGTLKSLNADSVFKNVKCEFEFDSCGGIKKGYFSNLDVFHDNLFIGKHFYFKNDELVMVIYINRIRNDVAHFQTIRLKRILDNEKTNNLIFFVTKTELFWNQKLNVEGDKLTLARYSELCTVDFEVSINVNPTIMKRLRNTVENVLMYVQLVQTQYCKAYGYRYRNVLYIDYNSSEFKPYIYRKAETLRKEDIELFIERFSNSSFKDYLTSIVYRLISAKTNSIIDIKCVWLIFALEAIESVYNMKKGTDIKKSKEHKYFNNIVDDILPENDLIKIYYNSSNTVYWKPLLWIYRDKYVHFLRSVDDFDKPPENGQDEKLRYIFNNNYKVLSQEFKKLLLIAQRIIYEIIDIDYEKSFFKVV